MTIKKLLGLAAVAGLMFVAAPAGAVSLANPGAAVHVQGQAREGVTTEVQYRRHGYRPHRHHGWHRPHFVRRHHGWHRPHYRPHHRHWR